MKPSDLKSPFTWNERNILIHDRIWFIPERCENEEFTFPGWQNAQTFSAEQPLCVEYCSGNGAWIAAKAQANPHQNWVAVERKFERVQKIWSKIKNYALDNLLIICGEGHRATNEYFPDTSVDAVFINFPDPWPKKRHAKHRIVQPAFILEMKRILKDQGTLTLVTDDEAYSKSMIEDVLASGFFSSVFPHPYFSYEYSEYGSSYFEDLWRQKGKAIRYHVFKKLPTEH